MNTTETHTGQHLQGCVSCYSYVETLEAQNARTILAHHIDGTRCRQAETTRDCDRQHRWTGITSYGPRREHAVQAHVRVDVARDLDSVLRHTGGEYPVSGDETRKRFTLWGEWRNRSVWTLKGVHA